MRTAPYTPRRATVPPRRTPSFALPNRPFTHRLRLRAWALVGGAVLALSGTTLASALDGVRTYQVRPGDTLGRIAAATGVSVQHLASTNGLTDPDRIVAGQVLQLSSGGLAATTTTAASGPSYVVKPGDSLLKIALAHGTSVATLTRLNGIADPDRLVAGQRLALPAPTSSTAESAGQPSRVSAAMALQQRVVAEARRVAGPNVRIGVAARNLSTGAEIAVDADAAFPSASVMKLPILVEVERQVAAGTLRWSPTLRSQVGAMMAISDNLAANAVYDVVGEANVNATMARLGLTRTRLVNYFGDSRRPLDPGQNQTSPADMAELLEIVAGSSLISAEASANVRALLASNTDRSKLARLLPLGTAVAHKSGWFAGVANDVGIVTTASGARWVIAVFLEGVPDDESGNQAIAAISRAVFDAWA